MAFSGMMAAAVGACLLSTAGFSAADELSTKIEAIIHDQDYKHAHWGILVLDPKTGNELFSLNPDHLFAPASTTKLYSCAAALAALGADHRFETPVYARGTIKDGRLTGQLILVAQGDLTMGGRTDSDGGMSFKDHDHIYANGSTEGELTETDPLAGLSSLARQVAAAGIRQVGDVLVDDRLFNKARSSGSGPEIVTPIIINDNLVDIVVTPAAEEGKPATVTMRPETPFIQMDAQVMTTATGKQLRVNVTSAGPRAFKVRGTIPVSAKPLLRIYPVDDPAAFARALFVEALHREGVSVAASRFENSVNELPEKASYAGMTRVAALKSPPFSEVIKVTLKVSHNLYASTCPLLIAAKEGKKNLADGLRGQRRFLGDLGVDLDSVSFGGGAGGANADAVTPRASVSLLRAMSGRPEWPVFRASLPLLGVDGTLVDVVSADSPAKGKVAAKTGTLMWFDEMNERTLLTSKALAGVMTTAKGRELMVALYVNGVPLPPGITAKREGKTLGKICELIYQFAP